MRVIALLIGMIVLLSSCTHMQKIENAKKKIRRIAAEYPELVSIVDTTIIERDTTLIVKEFHYRDSVSTHREVFDDNIYLTMDSIYKVQQGNIEAWFELNKDNKLNYGITKQPELIYVSDTIMLVDTIFRERITTNTTQIINTKPNMLWNVWTSFRGYLWLILIALVIIIVVWLILKYRKK